MVELHPQIIEKNGKKEFAVLPYGEFLRLQEELEDYEDLKQPREAKAQEQDANTLTVDELKTELGLE